MEARSRVVHQSNPGTDLHYTAIFQNQNIVGALDSLQAMRDHYTSPFRKQPVDGTLHQRFRGWVQSRGGLVENHKTGIFQEHPRESQQLSLARRETLSPGEPCVHSIWKRLHPVPQAQLLEYMLQLLIGDRAVEKGQ